MKNLYQIAVASSLLLASTHLAGENLSTTKTEWQSLFDGHSTDGWRRAYVLAFRTVECIEEERSHGFTHSHNDTFNWDQVST